jgi:hypothetical protein
MEKIKVTFEVFINHVRNGVFKELGFSDVGDVIQQYNCSVEKPPNAPKHEFQNRPYYGYSQLYYFEHQSANNQKKPLHD